MTTDNSHLRNLEQWVIEEKKIITYKWLSLTLEVSANVSKQMLWEFLQEHKDVSSVYFVSGWDKKKQRHVIALIKDADVAGVKDRFEPVMSLHVYAVASELPKDSAQIWQVDYELKHAKFREAIQSGNEAPTETWSSIRCDGVGLRDRAIQRKLEIASAHSKPAYEPEMFASMGGRSNSMPISESKPAVVSSSKKAGSTGTLQGMFAKQVPATTSTADKEKLTKSNSGSGGLQSFFGKKTAPVAAAEIKQEPKQEPAPAPVQKAEEDDILDDLEKMDEDTPKKKLGGSSSQRLKKSDTVETKEDEEEPKETPEKKKPSVKKSSAKKASATSDAASKEKKSTKTEKGDKPASPAPAATPTKAPETLEDELALELELESQDNAGSKSKRLRKAADVEADAKEAPEDASTPSKKPTKKKGKKAAAADATTESAAEAEAGEGDDGEKKQKKRKRKSATGADGEDEGEEDADAATEKKKAKTKPKKEVEATEQQKKFGTFFAKPKEESESQSPPASLVATGAVASSPSASPAVAAAPGKRLKKITRKEKVVETYLDEEGFEVRREVEKLIEEEVEVDDEPASQAPATQSQSQSQSLSSANSQSQADKKGPKSTHQAKLGSFFKK